jgi:phosphoribosylamine--glycine ligase
VTIKIVLVGGGGREDALGRIIVRTGAELITVMANQNPSLSSISSKTIKLTESKPLDCIPDILETKPDLVYIGPDGMLDTDLADKLSSNGIKVASPTRAAFRIESSKDYMRTLMKRYSIPGIVPFYLLDEAYEVEKIINDTEKEYAIKPVGLTGGKGVKVMGDQLPDRKSAISYAKSILRKDKKVLLEEKIIGHEFSLQAFTDGIRISSMPIAQDYKRAYEGDLGPNTGGMGSITGADHSLPFLREDSQAKALKIMKKILDSMSSDGNLFRGIMYGQFMQTSKDLYLIEMNGRFADPEGMNVLTLFRGNISDMLFSIAEGKLASNNDVDFINQASVLKYIVPKGYGENPVPGKLKLDLSNMPEDLTIYYSTVNGSLTEFEMTKSRAIALISRASTIEQASASVESNLWRIKGEYHIRHDIGSPELMKRKQEMFKA